MAKKLLTSTRKGKERERNLLYKCECVFWRRTVLVECQDRIGALIGKGNDSVCL